MSSHADLPQIVCNPKFHVRSTTPCMFNPETSVLGPILAAVLRLGFVAIVTLVLRLRPGGLLIGGPPCSSWVFINRATSRRSRQRVNGDCQKRYVRESNTILAFIGSQYIDLLIFYLLWCLYPLNPLCDLEHIVGDGWPRHTIIVLKQVCAI